ncbi:iron-sulfur cluster biosynthesis family protein [Radiobacillus deserti]|uniref:Core domain-containing protein n=1 Tax=Radiobacillus deserti TaxID=2594883 RepID=A0A516KGM3_9BACI|nr:iron-sulfur cluster biosynthesis family protein [Radiobacillus deserti]QDP40534.1 hypothetical protein FN924_10245 [Radiobacillus deserti]
MQITLTETALNEIQSHKQSDEVLVIVYDTDDCGCAVNGIPSIRLNAVDPKTINSRYM